MINVNIIKSIIAKNIKNLSLLIEYRDISYKVVELSKLYQDKLEKDKLAKDKLYQYKAVELSKLYQDKLEKDKLEKDLLVELYQLEKDKLEKDLLVELYQLEKDKLEKDQLIDIICQNYLSLKEQIISLYQCDNCIDFNSQMIEILDLQYEYINLVNHENEFQEFLKQKGCSQNFIQNHSDTINTLRITILNQSNKGLEHLYECILLTNYNIVMHESLSDNTIQRHLKQLHATPAQRLDFVKQQFSLVRSYIETRHIQNNDIYNLLGCLQKLYSKIETSSLKELANIKQYQTYCKYISNRQNKQPNNEKSIS